MSDDYISDQDTQAQLIFNVLTESWGGAIERNDPKAESILTVLKTHYINHKEACEGVLNAAECLNTKYAKQNQSSVPLDHASNPIQRRMRVAKLRTELERAFKNFTEKSQEQEKGGTPKIEPIEGAKLHTFTLPSPDE